MKLKIGNAKLKIIYCLSIATAILVVIFSVSYSRHSFLSEKNIPYHYNTLSDIYDVMTFNADSALSMLNEFADTVDFNNLKKLEFYEYQILLAEARYKCRLGYVNEFEIKEAVHYFDSLTNEHPKNPDLLFLNSRANYSIATIDEENENFKESFANYLDALKLVERINGINKSRKDLVHFKALIYVRLGDILYWIDAYDAAIECLNKANQLFQHENNWSAMTRNHIIMAITYEHSFNYDKTFRHLSIADSLIMENDKDSPLKYETERINASLMYHIGYHDEPFKAIMRQYKTLESHHLKMEAAGVLGDMYYSKGMLDSAIYYYEQYFPENKYSIFDAANYIIEISLKTSNNELIAKYGPILQNETNKELMLSSIKIDISFLYEQYKTDIKHKKIYKSVFTFLSAIMFATIAFLIFGLYLLQLKKNVYNIEIDKKDFYINSLQEKINKKSSENKHIKQRVNSLENELNYIKTKRYLAHAPFDLKLKDLTESSSLCQQLIQISQDESIKTNTSYPNLILSEEAQKELIDLFNNKYDNAFNKLISEHESLKPGDNLYFCLYLLGMNEKHISAVTGKTYNTIYNRTKRIQEILGSRDSIRETLRNIIV